MPEQKTISQFLNNHLWQIITITVTGIIALTLLKSEVNGLILRVDAIEIKQAEYPSKDWFELKFANIEEKIDVNTSKLNN